MRNDARPGKIELRQTSAAHRTLCMLVDVGGTWSIMRLRNAFYKDNDDGNSNFKANVTRRLQDLGFVTSDKINMTVTQRGREYVDAVRKGNRKSKQYVGVVASPRQYDVLKRKPLDYSAVINSGDRRPGSLDYRQLPSVMGDERRYPSGANTQHD